MTNEAFLNKKFPQACGPYNDGEKVDYLLDQVEWMQENFVYVENAWGGGADISYQDEYGEKQFTTGSCLLEAIENAQKEQESV